MTNGTRSWQRRLGIARLGIFSGLALFALMTPIAAAQAPPAAEEKKPDPDAGFLGFFRSTELGGLVDAYYDYNANKNDLAFRNFDTKHNQFAYTMAELWLAKTPTADSRTGFNVKLNFGPATSNFINATEPGGSAYQNIQQAYVSYLAPAGKGLQFDVGKFVTHNGAEVIEAKDNWNYSRSLLFSWAIPYYHAGVRATYTVNDKVSVMGMVANGWNNVVENNTGKTVGGQITIKPTKEVTIVQNYTGGPEQTNDNNDWRHLSDTVVTCTVNPMLSLMANYDYGRDTVAKTTVHWQGIAGYAKYQANKWVAVVPRVEYYDDASGFTLGAVQKLKEATVTLELKPADNFMWRIDYRGDFSDKASFTDDAGKPSKNQHTIAFGFLYSFSTKQ